MTRNRMEAFSDGVIAIIITIMVLELRVPHGASLVALRPIGPVFLSYLLSFVFLGIYWSNHHHLLQAVEHVSGGVLWANLHLLFWLSLTPFVTTWMGENHFAPLPVALYGVVLLFAAIAYFILTRALLAIHTSDSTLAIALGADSLKTLAYWGTDDLAGWRSLGRYGVLCDRWGLPFQAEVIPFGFGATDKHTPENIAIGARCGAESGADYVKVQYTGDPDSFRQVCEGAGVPVIILGGAKSERPITGQVADSIRAGGAGIAFGRNIWSTPDAEAAVRSLNAAIHGSEARTKGQPQVVRA